MLVQAVTGTPLPDGKIGFSWLVLTDHRAVSIHVGFDPEFKNSERHFVLPAGVTQCSLDLGPGAWFYRVGAWIGDKHKGHIEWSGIYGPTLLRARKAVVPTVPERLKVLDVQSLEGGMRFNTGRMEEYYALAECRRAGETRWLYTLDIGVGHFDVAGLALGEAYAFRVFDCGGAALPTDRVHQLGEGVRIQDKVTLSSGRSLNIGDFSDHKAERAVLRDAAERKSMRFSSQADYLKFVAAKAKTTGARERV
jgi:hypothetical protein